MRNIWTWLLLGTVCICSLQAEFNRPVYDTEIAAGYRRDSLRWSMHFQESDFTTSSSSHIPKSPIFEQYWKSIEIYNFSARTAVTSCNNYYFRANADWGKVTKGTSRSSEFTNLLRPTQETGRIYGHVPKGQVMDFQAGVGYTWTSNGRRCLMTPVGGWSYHIQRFYSHHHTQAINKLDVPQLLGAIPDLHYNYKPAWYGPWAGLDFLVSVDVPCTLLYGSLEYHWIQYRARGEWNFNDTFINRFKQTGNGHGLVGYLGFSYRIGWGWNLGVLGVYQNWQTRHGKSRDRSTYVLNDLTDTTQVFGTMPIIPVGQSTRMRQVRWNSWYVALSLDYRFYQ